MVATAGTQPGHSFNGKTSALGVEIDDSNSSGLSKKKLNQLTKWINH